MKALTISQPFASLIASGEKWVENRIWGTEYRGPLAIHAGKGKQYLSTEELKEYPTGCVIAVSNLVACECISMIREKDSSPDQRKKPIPGSRRNWSEVARHRHAEGFVCWILEDVEELEVRLPWRGAQGIWDVPDFDIKNALTSWIRTVDAKPADGEIVETKVHDGISCRNEQNLQRSGQLWFIPNASLHVYYTPTHWRPIQ